MFKSISIFNCSNSLFIEQCKQCLTSQFSPLSLRCDYNAKKGLFTIYFNIASEDSLWCNTYLEVHNAFKKQMLTKEITSIDMKISTFLNQQTVHLTYTLKDIEAHNTAQIKLK